MGESHKYRERKRSREKRRNDNTNDNGENIAKLFLDLVIAIRDKSKNQINPFL